MSEEAMKTARLKRFASNVGVKRKFAESTSTSSKNRTLVDLTGATPSSTISNTSSSLHSSSRILSDVQHTLKAQIESDGKLAEILQAQINPTKHNKIGNNSTNNTPVESSDTNWNAIYEEIEKELNLSVVEFDEGSLIKECKVEVDKKNKQWKVKEKEIVSRIIGLLKLRDGKKSSILLKFYLATSIKAFLGSESRTKNQNKVSFSVYLPAFKELMLALGSSNKCESYQYGTEGTLRIMYNDIALHWLPGHISWWYKTAIKRQNQVNWTDIVRGLKQVGFNLNLQNPKIGDQVFSNACAGVCCQYVEHKGKLVLEWKIPGLVELGAY